MSFLVDTDTCSAHLKGTGNVSGRFLQYSGQLHISTLVTHNARHFVNIPDLEVADWLVS